MARNKEQIEAIERNMPKIFEVENKFQVNSTMVPEIKKWVNDVDYRFTEIIATQLASRVLEDGTTEAEFEIKSAKANGVHKNDKGR